MNNRVFISDHDHLRLKLTMQIVPEDEPVFILRACDTQALSTIRVYQSTMPPKSEGWKVIQAVIDDFTEFKNENPEKMGSPEKVY